MDSRILGVPIPFSTHLGTDRSTMVPSVRFPTLWPICFANESTIQHTSSDLQGRRREQYTALATIKQEPIPSLKAKETPKEPAAELPVEEKPAEHMTTAIVASMKLSKSAQVLDFSTYLCSRPSSMLHRLKPIGNRLRYQARLEGTTEEIDSSTCTSFAQVTIRECCYLSSSCVGTSSGEGEGAGTIRQSQPGLAPTKRISSV
jgi:hypothetical protein